MQATAFSGYTLKDLRREIDNQRRDVRQGGFPRATVQEWWIIPNNRGAILSITFDTNKGDNGVTTRSVSL